MPKPVSNEVSSKLEALKQKFLDKAVVECDALDAIAQSITDAEACYEQLEQAYRILHRLAGSAGTFGFSALGEEARRLEVQLKPFLDGDSQTSPVLPSDISPELSQRLSGLRGLLRLADTAEPQTKSNFPTARVEQLILVVDPDPGRATQLTSGLSLYGYRFSWLPSVKEWQQRPENVPSALIIRDDVFLASGGECAELFPGLPIICLGAADSYPRRYALAREGAEAFFCDPLNLPLLADHLERLLTDHADAESGRVLIVDDDPELREHYRLVLTNGGLEVETVTGDPARLLSVLSAFRPDIVLMDVQMGEIAGPALARMLRFEPEWLSLPIVYLSAEQDREIQLEALAKGGDDFLTKPVSDSFLLRTAKIRCYRAKQLDKLVSRDSLTGLLKHSLVKTEILKEHARCQRLKHQSAVAMLDLDHFKQVNDNQGHRAGDLVIKGLANLLRHRLRKTDIIGRYGGEEFIVALPECSLKRAVTVLESVCEDFAKITFEGNSGEFHVTLSVGLTTLSAYASSEEAIEAADQALYGRKRAGRNGVTTAS
ncbi:diguanylate cyclase [Marinobacter sp. CHS3-4]|uniref:diguanylate cyclase n=1 Tax=Marinobacter sp. CHS3-4 TaxID=3045174 RepID=UPI0024B4D132|nr:diguanylate cyclase [Marinobacter sp. CHS3-4]MDI9244022.1 diguanylate cyclase [Marinobacter sp. CHS3-4]